MNGRHPVVGRSDAPRAIIAFPIQDGGKSTFENMHAKCVSGDIYIIDNSPFYAYDISFGDKVLIKKLGEKLLFCKVLERGGHSTYRIKLPLGEDHEYFLKFWSALSQIGCSYEGSAINARRLYALDLPPEVDVAVAYAILEEYEEAGIWEFEEAHYCDRRH